MSEYHEPEGELDPKTRDLHRALASLKEEIEAVDWYNQRVACANDDQLRRILEHNRNEEIEHACMTLEWLRRNMPPWNEALTTYLFARGDVVEREHEVEEGTRDEGADAGAPTGGSRAGKDTSMRTRSEASTSSGRGSNGRGLGVGSLRRTEGS
jgi:ferritin-like protein